MKYGKMRIIGLILLALGSYLEVYYYAVRFNADGVHLFLAFLIGFALNILLLTLFQLPGFWNKMLAYILIAFSVFCTSAGQTFAQIQKVKNEAVSVNIETIELYEKQIQEYQKEWDAIGIQKGQLGTLEERYEWKNTLDKATERQGELEELIREKTSALKDMKDPKVSESGDVYAFYERITGIKADWVKLIMHTLLSVFIAIMGPRGMKFFLMDKNLVEKPVENVEKPVDKRRLTRGDWVRFMWRGERVGKMRIPSVATMKEYCYLGGYDWDDAFHQSMLKEAVTLGLIAETGELLGKAIAAEKVISE